MPITAACCASLPRSRTLTHYGLDNLLAQVWGERQSRCSREPLNLYVEGSSSRVDNIDPPAEERGTGGARPGQRDGFNYRGVKQKMGSALGPGDALYIPALWFHHVLSHDNDNDDGAGAGPGLGPGLGYRLGKSSGWRGWRGLGERVLEVSRSGRARHGRSVRQ